MNKLVVIDGNSLMNRAFYVMRDLQTPDGVYTGAVFGMLKMMVTLFFRMKPSHVAVCFDKKGATFRHAQYTDYKGNRKGMPPELAMQMPIMKEVLDSMGIPYLEFEGYEADDLIGTLAVDAVKKGWDSHVVTGDKDALQLVQFGVHVHITKKGTSEMKCYDEEAILTELGVRADQVIDFKAIQGDKSDNIPGIPGIGAVGAAKLLQEFGTLENVIDQVENIKTKKTRELVAMHSDLALLSKQLATIMIDVPLAYENDDLKWKGYDKSTLLSVLSKYRLRNLYSDIVGKLYPPGGGEALAASPAGRDDGEVFQTLTERLAEEVSAEYIPLERKNVAIYLALREYHPEKITLQQLYAPPHHEGKRGKYNTKYYCLLLNCEESLVERFRENRVNPEEMGVTDGALLSMWENVSPRGSVLLEFPDFAGLAEILQEKSLTKVGFDMKQEFLYGFLERLEHGFSGEFFDIAVAGYLDHPNFGKMELSELYDCKRAELNVQLETLTKTELLGKGAKKKAYAEVAAEAGEAYATYVVKNLLLLLLLYEYYIAFFRENAALSALFRDVEMPLLEVLASIEFEGFSIDEAELRYLDGHFSENIGRIEKKIYEIAGEAFNISSPRQLGTILFEKLGLPHGRKTKTGYSTDQDVLDKLKNKHEIVRLVMEYRFYSKLKSTYIDGLRGLLVYGKVHTSMDQLTAATGRLSSKDPNLQNIPTRAEEGRNLRKLFIAQPGCILLDADYSQIELRVLAELSKDETLLHAFRNQADIHRITASQVFGVAESEVSAEQRSAAKAVNFGIVYGQGDFGLSDVLNISITEARNYIEGYFKKYPGVAEYMKNVIMECREKGYSYTMTGRRRRVEDITSSNFLRRSAAERIARNTPIQGSAADIIKIAMVKVYEELKRRKMKSRLILQVHDELILNTFPEETETVKQLLRASMEEAASLSVPLIADINEGKNWYETK